MAAAKDSRYSLKVSPQMQKRAAKIVECLNDHAPIKFATVSQILLSALDLGLANLEVEFVERWQKAKSKSKPARQGKPRRRAA